MNATKQLHDLGQSLWLDNITRSLVSDGTLQRYIDVLTVTGLTSNPTIFDQAIKESSSYDADIRRLAQRAKQLTQSSSTSPSPISSALLICCARRTMPAKRSMATFRWKSRLNSLTMTLARAPKHCGCTAWRSGRI